MIRTKLPAGGVPTTLSGGIFVTCREVGNGFGYQWALKAR